MSFPNRTGRACRFFGCIRRFFGRAHRLCAAAWLLSGLFGAAPTLHAQFIQDLDTARSQIQALHLSKKRMLNRIEELQTELDQTQTVLKTKERMLAAQTRDPTNQLTALKENLNTASARLRATELQHRQALQAEKDKARSTIKQIETYEKQLADYQTKFNSLSERNASLEQRFAAVETNLPSEAAISEKLMPWKIGTGVGAGFAVLFFLLWIAKKPRS